MFRVHRGLPQGMAASVLGAEVFIALFLWRLSCTLDLEIVAYVDDINLISNTRQVLEAAISQLFHFEKTFSLQVAAIKSFVWGSNDFVVNDIALKWGFQAKKTVESLGTEWPLEAMATCCYTKDKARLGKADERLARLSHLPAKMTVKVATITVGVLSLLSYSVMISPTPYKALRSKVRAAMGMNVGAPELVFGVLSKGSVDPFVTWLLAALKFWHFSLSSLRGGVVCLLRSERMRKDAFFRGFSTSLVN